MADTNADNLFPAERTAVITGAASPRGIGRATADRLARDGWSIAILDLDGRGRQEDGRRDRPATGRWRRSASAPTSPTRTRSRPPSPRSKPACRRSSAWPTWPGSAPRSTSWTSPLAEWDRVFDINMRGTFLVTRRVVPAMIAAGVGRIVSVSSVSAQRGGGTYSKVPYSASKAALIGFTRALAREMGPHGITVNSRGPRADRHRHHGWDADRGAQGAS